MKLTNHDRATLATVWDTMIPGDSDWPMASTALPAPDAVALSDPDRAWLLAEAAGLADMQEASRAEALAILERNAPEPFARILNALYDAYYTSPPAHAVVRRLAEAGPHEASPLFDKRQLDRIIATQAGLRRPTEPPSFQFAARRDHIVPDR